MYCEPANERAMRLYRKLEYQIIKTETYAVKYRKP